jgi:tetratricopeptide (TPR) repeat protein
MKIVIACAVSAAFMLTTALPVYAQQPVEEYASGEPSSDQVRLNKSAVEAILAEDYKKATGLLEASLELGKLNVTYLNLGRAYQKLGECQKSKRAYLAVLTAPAVAEPPPKLINAKAEQYLEELEEECATDLAAGDAADMPGESGGEIEPPVGEQVESSNVLGWSATIGGGVLLATSGALFLAGDAQHAEVESAHQESNRAADGSVTEISRQRALDSQASGDALKTAALSTAIVGAAVTGLGVYWLLSDDGGESDTQVGLGAGASGWTVRFSTRF